MLVEPGLLLSPLEKRSCCFNTGGLVTNLVSFVLQNNWSKGSATLVLAEACWNERSGEERQELEAESNRFGETVRRGFLRSLKAVGERVWKLI